MRQYWRGEIYSNTSEESSMYSELQKFFDQLVKQLSEYYSIS